MDLEAFIQRIQNSSFLPPQTKAHFVAQAETYAPEKRQELVNVLTKHENQFLADADTRIQEIQAEKKAKHQEEAKTYEQNHTKDEALAEAQLMSDLDDL